MNWERLLEYSNGNKSVASQLINIFFAELSGQVALVKTAVESSDFPEVKSSAHRVKSSLRMFGYDEEAELSETLELAVVGQQSNVPSLSNDWLMKMEKVIEDLAVHRSK